MSKTTQFKDKLFIVFLYYFVLLAEGIFFVLFCFILLIKVHT